MNLTLNRALSSSYFTASEDLDLGLPDSPTLDLIISKFLMIPRLNPYSRIIVEIKGYKFATDGLVSFHTKIRDLGTVILSVRCSE